jgi:hypothetical protein
MEPTVRTICVSPSLIVTWRVWSIHSTSTPCGDAPPSLVGAHKVILLDVSWIKVN